MSLNDVSEVVHLAALVGVGQSMYEIDRYVCGNTAVTATMLERLVKQAPKIERLVVVSSCQIYGEGAYECHEHGLVIPDAGKPACK